MVGIISRLDFNRFAEPGVHGRPSGYDDKTCFAGVAVADTMPMADLIA
jgi:hypothetical protein